MSNDTSEKEIPLVSQQEDAAIEFSLSPGLDNLHVPPLLNPKST